MTAYPKATHLKKSAELKYSIQEQMQQKNRKKRCHLLTLPDGENANILPTTYQYSEKAEVSFCLEMYGSALSYGWGTNKSMLPDIFS